MSAAVRAALAALGLALGLGLGAPAAQAGDRYAIVIGSNHGEADEALLRFAERDAQRMADVLMRLGGVQAEDMLVLLSPDHDALARALAAFKQRIYRSEQASGAIVLVYYSGHADARALHLSGTRFPFGELRAAVRDIGADLSVFLVDACRSGGLLRTKGATPADPFTFEVEDAVVAQGTAIITSSAENEDAAESDRLEGGVFTHHLVTGLLGAADASGDDRVSLAEAYRYAYTQTLAATSDSAIVQHPTYAFQMQGQKEIVLTHLSAATGRGRLRLDGNGQYLVLERFGAREVVAELSAHPGTELSLQPGPYLVRRREPAAVFESQLDIRPDATTDLDPDAMERVPFRHAVRKGYGLKQRRALSLGADAELAGALLDGTGLLYGGALTAQLDLADIAVQVRFRYAHSDSSNARLELSTNLIGLDAGLYHLFDLGRHGVGFGLRAGVDWLAQRFVTQGEAPPTNQVLGRVGPFGRIELALGGAVTLQLDGGVEVYLLDVKYGQRTSLEPRVLPTVSLGIAVLLP
ncbi:MAG: caspase family protein [Myxococcota bacterium]